VVRVRRLVGNTDRRQQCVAAQRHGHPAPDRDQAYQSRTDGTHSRGATVAFRTRVGAGATLAHRPGGLLCPRRLVAEPAVGERGVIPRNHGRGAPGRNLDAQPTAVRHVAVPVSRVTLAVIAWSEMSEANSRPTLSTSFVAATASASVSVTSIDS